MSLSSIAKGAENLLARARRGELSESEQRVLDGALEASSYVARCAPRGERCRPRKRGASRRRRPHLAGRRCGAGACGLGRRPYGSQTTPEVLSRQRWWQPP